MIRDKIKMKREILALVILTLFLLSDFSDAEANVDHTSLGFDPPVESTSTVTPLDTDDLFPAVTKEEDLPPLDPVEGDVDSLDPRSPVTQEINNHPPLFVQPELVFGAKPEPIGKAPPLPIKVNFKLNDQNPQFVSPSAPPQLKEPFDRSFQLNLDVLHGATSVMVALDSSFRCESRRWGFFADIRTGCRNFVQCVPTTTPNGAVFTRRHVFRCPPGTQFDQRLVTCVLINDALPCEQSINYYLETEEKFGAFSGCNVPHPNSIRQETDKTTVEVPQQQLIESAPIIPHPVKTLPPVKSTVVIPPVVAQQISVAEETSPRALFSTAAPIVAQASLHISEPIAKASPAPIAVPPFPIRVGKINFKHHTKTHQRSKTNVNIHPIKGSNRHNHHIRKTVLKAPHPIKTFFKKVFAKPNVKHHLFISIGKFSPRPPFPATITQVQRPHFRPVAVRHPMKTSFRPTVGPVIRRQLVIKSPVHQLRETQDHQLTHAF